MDIALVTDRHTGPTLCLVKRAHDKNKQNTCCDASLRNKGLPHSKGNLENRLARWLALRGCRVRSLWPSAPLVCNYCFVGGRLWMSVGCGRPQGPRPATNRQWRTIHTLPARLELKPVQDFVLLPGDVVDDKRCSYAIKSVFSRGQKTALLRLKRCFQHGNAIEKDRSLRREWSFPA